MDYGSAAPSPAASAGTDKFATTAGQLWDRYSHVKDRGHRDYTFQAQSNERMYLGGGRQWDPEEAAALLKQKREAYEFNHILPSVNAAIGHQIHNRMDIAFRPRGGNADQEQADLRAKVVMHIADRCHLRWKETEVFADGLIQQRGYFDVRMNFDKNMQGDVVIAVEDPLDVIPDPDAKTYEPEGWADVCVTKWLTKDEIGGAFGDAAADKVFANKPQDSDWGEYDDTGAQRPKFADPNKYGKNYDAFYSLGGVVRVRLVARQWWVRSMSRVLYYPRTGDMKLAENLQPEVIRQQLEQGAIMSRSMQRRVRWAVGSCDTLVHDEWSPYDSFTIIPYFAYFRRGQTIGMVDNATGPQRALNKAVAQYVHIVNSAANSGWITEENSLANMTPAQLQAQGAMTGLHIEVKKGTKLAPTKIPPSTVPQGHDELIRLTTSALKSVTIPDAMRGEDGPDTSGVARQTQQFAAQQQIALPLDNLARTRHLLAEKLHNLTQQFYTEERTFQITEMDFKTGKPVTQAVTINQWVEEEGRFVNDLTEGDYDVVVSEQPAAVTFEDTQFRQALDLRDKGIAIPDSVLVQASSLSRKPDILEEMAAASGQSDPLTDAKVALMSAQRLKTLADQVQSAVTAMFSATQAANQIAAVPQVAPLADQLLRSAGFKDADAAPIVPAVPAGAAPLAIKNGTAQPGTRPAPGVVEPNTSPNFPPKPMQPDIGATAGIERADPGLAQPR